MHHDTGSQLDGPFLGPLCPRPGSCGLPQESLFTRMMARAGARVCQQATEPQFLLQMQTVLHGSAISPTHRTLLKTPLVPSM